MKNASISTGMPRTRALYAATTLAALTTFPGCGASELSCGNKNVTDRVKEIVKSGIGKQIFSSIVDLDQSQIYLEEIITRDTQARKIVCHAELKSKLHYKQQADGVPQITDDIAASYGVRSPNGPIDYIAELTDDNKIYVRAQKSR